MFDWIAPVVMTKEQQLVDKIGMDATLFLRFGRMSRNIFFCVTVVGCGVIIPLNLIAGKSESSGFSDVAIFRKLTPAFVNGNAFWAYVVVAYVFDVIICFFLWHNYRAVLRLRRAYFDSPDYQRSLHSRTLLITEIPKGLRTDEGLVKIADEAKDTGSSPRTAIARNVKDLPELIEEHDNAVRELESILAKYMKNPNKLPTKRPTCKVSKSDQSYRKGQKVDAIEYLTSRVRNLEHEIKEVRETVDKRNAMSFGFASYEAIADAHTVAYAARKKGPQHTYIRLAPKPHDLIWKNLPMGHKQRRWQTFINNVWVAVLTLVWIAPNALIAIFLSNLSNLGLVWPAFQTNLEAHSTIWAIVQGVAAPAITTLFYFFLPAIFRRLSMKAGDMTKTSRDRHVMHKLYTFFIINNLIVFSLFAAVWTFVTAVINNSQHEGVWESIKKGGLFSHGISSLIQVSTYWLTWLLQRNLGAAVDLAQLITLFWGSFSRHFLSPTPRELIELSAPQPFDYSGYYNYFLFYATIAMCFATIQPLVLPVTAFYFWMDSYLKKYLLLYVFITKTESGGLFWRVLFNRYLVLAFLGNLVIALLVGAQGSTWTQLICMAPLPFLLVAFKLYCAKAFDNKCAYYTTGKRRGDAELAQAGEAKKSRRGDRVGVRFGHPVLYKPLITPMVHAKSQHLLRDIYSGRTSDDGATTTGYSEFYMDNMSHDQPGRSAAAAAAGHAPFEIVTEGQLDFEHYKNRPEFRDELGGDGELYGRPADLIRRGSGSTMMTADSTIPPSLTRTSSRDSDLTRIADGPGTVYPPGYHKTPNALRDSSPASSVHSVDVGTARGRAGSEGGYENLLSGAARMGRSPPPPTLPMPGGYAPLRLGDLGTPEENREEDTSYDYFRRGRQR